MFFFISVHLIMDCHTISCAPSLLLLIKDNKFLPLQQGLAHGERAAVSFSVWHCDVHRTDDESQWSACSFSIAVSSHTVPGLMLSSAFQTWPGFISRPDSVLWPCDSQVGSDWVMALCKHAQLLGHTEQAKLP